MQILKVTSEIYLTPYKKNDTVSLVKYLNDLTIYENMLVIPYPYKEADAEWFINKILEDQSNGNYEFKAIRMNDELIGGIGFKLLYGSDSHKDEIAYWLAAPFRNKGIMTNAISVLCRDAFEKRALQRIEATTFEFNPTSSRVLEKAGFKREGTLRNFYQKNGKVFGGNLYSLIPEDLK